MTFEAELKPGEYVVPAGRRGQVKVPVRRDLPVGESWDHAQAQAAKQGAIAATSVSDSVFDGYIDFTFDIVAEEKS